jgi:hypothetical protein
MTHPPSVSILRVFWVESKQTVSSSVIIAGACSLTQSPSDAIPHAQYAKQRVLMELAGYVGRITTTRRRTDLQKEKRPELRHAVVERGSKLNSSDAYVVSDGHSAFHK